MQKRTRLESSHIGRLAISGLSRRPRQNRQARASSERSMTLRRKTKKKTIDLPVDAARSALMGRVRQKHSAPELEVRRLLRIRFLPVASEIASGTPDIIVPDAKCAIFVHGCFWHRHPSCSKATMPKTRVAFWTQIREECRTRRPQSPSPSGDGMEGSYSVGVPMQETGETQEPIETTASRNNPSRASNADVWIISRLLRGFAPVNTTPCAGARSISCAGRSSAHAVC